MYVNISQVFKIWAIPFYAAHVELVSVLIIRPLLVLIAV